jgi:DNA invertase Pin-like site-specific DNA recombinase
MSWSALLDMIAEEVGAAAAARIEARARKEMGGIRLTIGVKPIVTRDVIDAIAPGRPKEAAKALGVHQTTIYRALRRPVIR